MAARFSESGQLRLIQPSCLGRIARGRLHTLLRTSAGIQVLISDAVSIQSVRFYSNRFGQIFVEMLPCG